MAEKQKPGKIKELVASASQILISMGFSSIQRGIQVEGGRRGQSELLFPCALSACGFWLLFKDYEWESDAYQCLSVELSNIELERRWRILEPKERHRFLTSSGITPASVVAYLNAQASEGASEIK